MNPFLIAKLMKTVLPIAVLALAVLVMGGLCFYEVDQAFQRYRSENEALGQSVVMLLDEQDRLVSCAQRQITSLIRVCDSNGIELCQAAGTSEWFEGPKPMTRKEFYEYKAMLLAYKVCGEVASFAHDTIVYRFPNSNSPDPF